MMNCCKTGRIAKHPGGNFACRTAPPARSSLPTLSSSVHRVALVWLERANLTQCGNFGGPFTDFPSRISRKFRSCQWTYCVLYRAKCQRNRAGLLRLGCLLPFMTSSDTDDGSFNASLSLWSVLGKLESSSLDIITNTPQASHRQFRTLMSLNMLCQKKN